MAWQFRKVKRFGPLRPSLTKRGVGTSIGFGPLRYSLGADGKIRRTRRIPGTGVLRHGVRWRPRQGGPVMTLVYLCVALIGTVVIAVVAFIAGYDIAKRGNPFATRRQP